MLRQLTTDVDDVAYFESLQASRDHLWEFESQTVLKYPDLESVRNARLHPTNASKLRMGIWLANTFVGSANITPRHVYEDEAEIGYWLDARHTGNGYATLAVRALVRYGFYHYARFYAKVDQGNIASERVLERAGFYRSGKEIDRTIFDLDDIKWLAEHPIKTKE